MLRFSPAIGATQAAHYYRREFSRGDYYTRGETVIASSWRGSGARALDLAGPVKAAGFARLLEGRDARGNVLVPPRAGKAERRAAWDVTISPHKSVSLVALVAGDDRVREAHDRAVEVALTELERHAESWASGGREIVGTGNAVIATFQHETSRALDPQLHTHCVVMNMTRRDGEWRALHERGMFRAQKLAREIYEAELARGLTRLGYDIQVYRDGRHGKDRAIGIAGFTDEQLRSFSRRSQQIEGKLAELGLDSRLSGERVAVKNRAKKLKEMDRDALIERWREGARAAGIEFQERPAIRQTPDFRSIERTREAVDGAVAHLAERRSVFKLSDLEREALIRGRVQGVTIDAVRREIGRRGDLLMATPDDAPRARVTTVRAASDERTLLGIAEAGRGQAPTLSTSFAGRGLGDDQERVARHVLESPDRLLAVEGKAGTGKSHTLAAVREQAEAAGWTVRGFAPTTTATAVLQESGIESMTVSAALRERTLGWPPVPRGPELWIVDEASLLSTEQARRFLTIARDELAKVVLVGDRGQHRAVEAGSPFELLIDRQSVSVARLDTVRRQQDAALREAVVAASEAPGVRQAVTLLERQGRIVEIEDRRARHEQIAADFLADGGRGIVIAPSNAERTDLNRRIREGLIEAGQVERRSFKASVVVKQDVTAEQRTRAASFARGDGLRFVRRGGGFEAGERVRVLTIDEKHNRLVVEGLRAGVVEFNPKERRGFEVERVEERRFAVGDRIQFRERDRALDLANGTLGTIERLNYETGDAVVSVGNRRFHVDLRELRAIDHAYAVTSHRSQGLSRERVYLTVDTRHSEELVNRRQFYVSVSRAVQDARIYTDDRQALARAVGREQGRESALSIVDEGRVSAVEPAAPTPVTPAPLTAAGLPQPPRPETALDIAANNADAAQRDRTVETLPPVPDPAALRGRTLEPRPGALKEAMARAVAMLAGFDPPSILRGRSPDRDR